MNIKGFYGNLRILRALRDFKEFLEILTDYKEFF